MMKPEPIGPVPSTSLRALRMKRLAQRWAEQGGDLRDAPAELLEAAVVTVAEERGKDLDEAQVAKVCHEAVASWVDGREQREAQAAIDGAREAEEQERRERYLAEAGARYRLGLSGGGTVTGHRQPSKPEGQR